jgi:hypothetical protein
MCYCWVLVIAASWQQKQLKILVVVFGIAAWAA